MCSVLILLNSKLGVTETLINRKSAQKISWDTGYKYRDHPRQAHSDIVTVTVTTVTVTVTVTDCDCNSVQ